jgi:hypothetical protein
VSCLCVCGEGEEWILIEADDMESVERAESALVCRISLYLSEKEREVGPRVIARKPPPVPPQHAPLSPRAGAAPLTATVAAAPAPTTSSGSVDPTLLTSLHKSRLKKMSTSSASSSPSLAHSPDPQPQLQRPPTPPLPRRHLILNSSDIFFTAQLLDSNKKPNYAVRLDARELTLVLSHEQKGGGGGEGGVGEESETGGMRVVGGTKPSAKNAIWRVWEALGFRVHVTSGAPHCVGGGGGGAEERDGSSRGGGGVDHYLLEQTISLVHRETRRGGGGRGRGGRGRGGRSQSTATERADTLVLCLGKGIDLFSGVIREAVEVAGWKVEIWSWRRALSPVTVELVREFPNLVTRHDLDTFSHRILYG